MPPAILTVLCRTTGSTPMAVTCCAFPMTDGQTFLTWPLKLEKWSRRESAGFLHFHCPCTENQYQIFIIIISKGCVLALASRRVLRLISRTYEPVAKMKEFSCMCKFSKVRSINTISSSLMSLHFNSNSMSLVMGWEMRRFHWFQCRDGLCLLIPFCTDSCWCRVDRGRCGQVRCHWHRLYYDRRRSCHPGI